MTKRNTKKRSNSRNRSQLLWFAMVTAALGLTFLRSSVSSVQLAQRLEPQAPHAPASVAPNHLPR